MKPFLRFLFNRYRSEFESLFISDMFGEIPKEVSENALTFLLSGKPQLDRFFRWNAYVIQKKMERPTKHAQSYVGGLVFIQALDTALSRLEQVKRISPVDEALAPEKDIEESMRGVDDFFKPRSVETQ